VPSSVHETLDRTPVTMTQGRHAYDKCVASKPFGCLSSIMEYILVISLDNNNKNLFVRLTFCLFLQKKKSKEDTTSRDQ
jgi:hypothetical protein